MHWNEWRAFEKKNFSSALVDLNSLNTTQYFSSKEAKDKTTTFIALNIEPLLSLVF